VVHKKSAASVTFANASSRRRDAARLYAVPQQRYGGVPQEETRLTRDQVQQKTMQFILNFGRDGEFVYRFVTRAFC
jgi:hypothetical protein